jgi:hypothetical protein
MRTRLRAARMAAIVLLALAASVTAPPRALAGAGLIPVCTAAGDQSSPRAISDGAGGAIVAWIDGRPGEAGIYAHHVLANGDMDSAWPPQGLALCTAPGNRSNLAIAADGAGGAFVAWQDDRDGFQNVFVQHAQHSGTPDPAWPQDGITLNATAGDRWRPSVDFDGLSGAVIAWEEWRSESTADLFAQHVQRSGAVDWAPGGVAVAVATDSAGKVQPMVVSDDAGGAIIAFVDTSVCGLCSPYIRAQHVRNGGDLDPAWPPEGVKLSGWSYWYAERHATFATSDGAGGAFVAYGHDAGILASAVSYEHVLPSGVIAPPVTIGGSQAHRGMIEPAVAPDGLGGMVGAWIEVWYDFFPYPPVWHHQLHVTPYNWAPGPTYNGVEVYRPVVVGDGTGGTIVAWLTNDSPGPGNLYVGHVLPNGLADPGCPPGGKWVSGMPWAPQLVANGTGGALLVWQVHSESAGWDIEASLMLGPQPTGILASLVSADATVDHVRLEWVLEDASGPAVTVYRRTDQSAWQAVAAVTPDGSGRLVFVDRAVTGETRYGYRLGLTVSGIGSFAGETWVDVPGAPALVLHGLRPNPASGVLRVSFALPGARPAMLELFDISGRRLISQEVGSLGAGSHVVSLASSQSLAAGTYIVRLSQGGRSITVRAAVMR